MLSQERKLENVHRSADSSGGTITDCTSIQEPKVQKLQTNAMK